MISAHITTMTNNPGTRVQADRSILTRPGTCLVAAALMLAAASASAQTSGGALVSGAITAAVTESEVQPSIQGFIGYRFNRALGIGVELAWLPTAEQDLPLPLRPWYSGEGEGDILTFTTNVRVEIPTAFRRVLPFVVGGGGVASVSRDYDVRILDAPYPLTGLNAEPGRRERRGITRPLPTSLVFPSIFPPPPSPTSTGLALTLGGGASLLVTDRLSFDVDLRALHIRGAARQTIGKFGVGASYRF